MVLELKVLENQCCTFDTLYGIAANTLGTFFKALNKHFPLSSKYCKIFSRHNVKFTYSAMSCQVVYKAAIEYNYQ